MGGVPLQDIYDFFDAYPAPPIKTYITQASTGEFSLNVWGEFNDYSDVDWDNGDEDAYEAWGELLVDAFSGYSCADGGLTNPHISSLRGATFRNSDDYLYAANFAVGQWQTAYGDGVHVGTSADVCLIDDDLDEDGDCYVGYGFMTMFYGRSYKTKKFQPAWDLSDDDIELSAAWKNGELLLDSLDSSDYDGGQSGSQGGSEGGNQNQRRLSSAAEYDGSCGMSS